MSLLIITSMGNQHFSNIYAFLNFLCFVQIKIHWDYLLVACLKGILTRHLSTKRHWINDYSKKILAICKYFVVPVEVTIWANGS